MLVEMAIGDSYGGGFEFITPEVASENVMFNDGETYYANPQIPIGNGRYTDDTQMALAITEALLAGGEFAPNEMAPRFFDVFKRDPRQGYGSGFYKLLCEVKDGEELYARLMPNSTRSGAAMRAGPIGLYADIKMVKTMAILQAATTHHTGEGMGSAAAIALMTHYYAYKLGPHEGVGEFIAQHIPGHADWTADHTGWVTVEGVPCAHAAITAVKNGTSYTDVLKRSIAFGGDVDTIAAMAMFAVSLTDLPNDLSPKLYEGLENGEYGLDYLRDMDVKLMQFLRAQSML
jgi:ADP-ribosyl-[dinitrogen reductase] hydrolase